MKIIPSVLVPTAEEYLKQTEAVEAVLEMIQLDIADGQFVPNATWADPEFVKNNTKIAVELHLMVSDPLAELKKWINVKQIKRILFHCESTADLDSVISFAKKQNWECGLALNPDTDPEVLKPYLNKIQAVMFMGVYPGFQGQKLIPEVLEKIKAIKTQQPDIFVELDGGVNEKTLPQIIEAGTDAICPGSAVFGNDNTPAENIKRLREIIISQYHNITIS